MMTEGVVIRLEMQRRTFLALAAEPFLVNAQQTHSVTPTPHREYLATKFGTQGDGKTADTVAIQKAIDTCSKDGGGLVRIPQGRYLCGSLLLRNRVVLYL